MKYSLLKALLTFLFFITLNQLIISKAFAYPLNGFFCSKDGSTIWGVYATYTDDNGSSTPPFNQYANTSGDAGGFCPAGTDKWTMWLLGERGTPAQVENDYYVWHTACVDPKSSVNATSLVEPDGTSMNFSKDITCPSTNSYGGQPASCNGANDSGKQISATGWCPFGPYCMYNGIPYSATLGSGNGLGKLTSSLILMA